MIYADTVSVIPHASHTGVCHSGIIINKERNEKRRFDRQYQKHLTALKLQDMADTTRDIYARAVRRVVSVYDCCPDHITQDQ